MKMAGLLLNQTNDVAENPLSELIKLIKLIKLISGR